MLTRRILIFCLDRAAWIAKRLLPLLWFVTMLDGEVSGPYHTQPDCEHALAAKVQQQIGRVGLCVRR